MLLLILWMHDSGITNYGIAELVYGPVSVVGGRNENIELPDFEEVARLMSTRKNMTLMDFYGLNPKNPD